MRLLEIKQVKREKNTFHINGHRIPSVRQASDGFGVMLVFEASQLDKDMEVAVGPGCYCWFPTATQLKVIVEALDLSDQLTRDHLCRGKGWRSGPRPVRDLKDFV